MSGDTAASAVSSSWGPRRSGNLCEEEGQGTPVYWATGTDSDTGQKSAFLLSRGYHGKGGPNVKNGKQ